LFVPDHKPLLSPETKDAAYALLSDIRNAETARELLVYMRNFHEGAAEFRNLLSLIESEIARKIGEFAEEAETVAQMIPERPTLVPDEDDQLREERG
jgi:hypothetical protein